MGFDPRSMFVNCNLGAPSEKYLGCGLVYKGEVNGRVGNKGIGAAIRKRNITFTDLHTRGFNVGFNNNTKPILMPGSNLAVSSTSCALIANSSAVTQPISKMLSKFDASFGKGKSLGPYLKAGTSQSAFRRARENVAAVVDMYREAIMDADEEEEDEGEEEEDIMSKL